MNIRSITFFFLLFLTSNLVAIDEHVTQKVAVASALVAIRAAINSGDMVSACDGLLHFVGCGLPADVVKGELRALQDYARSRGQADFTSRVEVVGSMMEENKK